MQSFFHHLLSSQVQKVWMFMYSFVLMLCIIRKVRTSHVCIDFDFMLRLVLYSSENCCLECKNDENL